MICGRSMPEAGVFRCGTKECPKFFKPEDRKDPDFKQADFSHTCGQYNPTQLEMP